MKIVSEDGYMPTNHLRYVWFCGEAKLQQLHTNDVEGFDPVWRDVPTVTEESK